MSNLSACFNQAALNVPLTARAKLNLQANSAAASSSNFSAPPAVDISMLTKRIIEESSLKTAAALSVELVPEWFLRIGQQIESDVEVVRKEVRATLGVSAHDGDKSLYREDTGDYSHAFDELKKMLC